MAVLGLVPGAAAATASAAVTSARAPGHAALVTTPDVVLINQPASSVCFGKTFTVGVWYQQFSGGSRAYRILVYDRSWRLIFYRSGWASSTAWSLWRIRAWRLGNYHTTYKLKDSSGLWFKYRAVTLSYGC
jgi:hypothetical protein